MSNLSENMVKTREILNEFNTYVPGRSKKEIMEEYGVKQEDIIKLGSNENPWGPSPKVKEAIEKELANINRYPESEGAEDLIKISQTISKEYNLC